MIKDITGQTFGRLTVVARAGSNRQRMMTWHCQCACGNDTVVAGAYLRNGQTKSCGCWKIAARKQRTGAAHHGWLGDQVTYHTAHDRVRHTRGPARGHACIDCASPADQWSLMRGRGVLAGANCKGSVMLYSPHPADYEPRCRPCHARYDAKD